MPGEGATARALALFRFDSFAAYEQYRELFGVHPNLIAADAIRDRSDCVQRYERTVMRPVLDGVWSPHGDASADPPVERSLDPSGGQPQQDGRVKIVSEALLLGLPVKLDANRRRAAVAMERRRRERGRLTDHTVRGDAMKVTVLGAPSSAGAYCVGVERAPAALRRAGLVEALQVAGTEVTDAGDLTMRWWRPDRESPLVQNAGEESRAVRELATAAAERLAPGERLLVLGGSCMVAVGLCAGMKQRGQPAHLVYIDRHLDLNTPHSTTEGSLSWMGMAHALALDGTVPELAGEPGSAPLLHPSDLVYLGADPTRETTAWERQQADDLALAIIDQAELCAAPRAAARRARATLTEGPFLVHVDVDVLDFLDAPIAENVNGRNSGPTIAVLGQALVELVQDPDCWGVSIGQLDPAHAASDPSALPRLVSALVSALGVTPDDQPTP